MPEAYQVDAVLRTGIIRHVISLVKHADKLGRAAYAEADELRAAAAHEGKSIEQLMPPTIRQKLSISDYLIAPCVRIMGNIVSGSDQQTTEVVRAGFYEVIEICIDHRVKNIKKESCWALSNVVAGTSDQLDEYFKKESLVKKVILLCREGDLNVRKEAGWCLSNAICGASFEQISILVKLGFIEAMVGLLNCTQSDKVLMMAMEALEGCLTAFNKHNRKPDHEYNPFVERMEEIGGLDLLEGIQALDAVPERCCTMAANFVSKFWPDLSDDSEGRDVAGDDNDPHFYDNNDTGENGDAVFDFGDDTQMASKSTNQPFQF